MASAAEAVVVVVASAVVAVAVPAVAPVVVPDATEYLSGFYPHQSCDSLDQACLGRAGRLTKSGHLTSPMA